jgi:hypothetical protein
MGSKSCKKMFATRINVDLLKEIKHLAVDTDKSIADLVEEAIQDLMVKYREPAKKH